jgi:hypothetical protein
MKKIYILLKEHVSMPQSITPESLIKDFSWAKVPKQDVCLPEDLF